VSFVEEVLFLDIEDVIEIHEIILKRYGGRGGIRDKNLLHSAVSQPQQTFGGQLLYKSIPEMAAVYAYHLAENQPFIDGNKRTAFVASAVFLRLNGFKLIASNDEVYQLFIDLANKKFAKNNLVDWYTKRTKAI
jgi:death-on-curing protein